MTSNTRKKTKHKTHENHSCFHGNRFSAMGNYKRRLQMCAEVREEKERGVHRLKALCYDRGIDFLIESEADV